MTIESISPIAAPSLTPTVEPSALMSQPSVDFTTVMEGAMAGASRDVAAAETALQGLASGKPVELHDLMISLENARLSVQTLIQVRNRVVEAYQELSRMQV